MNDAIREFAQNPDRYTMIAADVERDIVANEVIEFLRRLQTPGDLACAM